LPNEITSVEASPLKKFSSYEAMNDFIKSSQATSRVGFWDQITLFSGGTAEQSDGSQPAPD
jgi:hypothetical protein